jgi:hypothetical protein
MKMLYGRWHSCYQVKNIENQGEQKVKENKQRVAKNARMATVRKYSLTKL